MSDFATLEEAFQRIGRPDDRYHERGYLFGLLAPTVLGHWGIAATEDLGRIVFTLIDVGLLASQPTDKLQDFERVYEFDEVFRAGYPWPGVERG